MNDRGVFIVLEGSDGSGKTTQFNLLKERLQAVGYDVAVFDFPQYDKPSGYFAKSYLNGHYGPASKISPYTASLFYALDRFEAASEIKKALDEGKIVLANRYAGSNMAHQGSKFDDSVEQRGFFVWADNLEFQLLGIPRPDINLFLRVPADISYNLIAGKQARNYTKNTRDEHEKDKRHLRKSVATYDLLCQLFPKDFKTIECSKNGKLKSVAQINNLIWERLKPMLPNNKPHASHSVVVTLGLNDQTKVPAKPQNSEELELNFIDASLILYLHLLRSSHSGLVPEHLNWADSNFGFYMPANLPKEIKETYKVTMDRLIGARAELLAKLDKHLSHSASDNSSPAHLAKLLLPITPLSALTNIKLSLRKSDIAPLAASLLASDVAELQWAAKQLYLAARQKWPGEFDTPLESNDSPVSLNNIIAKLAEERLSHAFSSADAVKLLEIRPRLEFDLLAESIYPYSSLSLDDIAEEVSNWPYSQKHDSLKEALNQPEILAKVRYKLDVLSDQITLNEVKHSARLGDIQVQAYTPRYGYEVPRIIEDAAADDLYDTCFDESLKLYSLMQGAGQESPAAYAVLLGHKVRWQLNVSAAQLKQITDDDKLSITPVVESIMEKVSEVHPLLWEIISRAKIVAPPAERNGKSRVKPLHKTPAKKNTRKKRL